MYTTHRVWTIGLGVEETRDGERIDPVRLARNRKVVAEYLAEAFGGYTFQDTVGGWVDPAGRLVEERGLTIIVLVPDGHKAYGLDGFANVATYVGQVFGQHSVAVYSGDRGTIIECF